MKFSFKPIILGFAGLIGMAIASYAENLVILTTNDTHSTIDIGPDGVGGVLPRKAIIDSVRKAEKNVMLVDAGDIVQGSLYFKYFNGDVEYPLFNMMDYDIRILGNHEFDNGLDELAKYWKGVKGARLSANYDFKGTSAEGLFEPYIIKNIGKKKIGFIGINVDPHSLISRQNYEGMKYTDAMEAANKFAAELRHRKKCDLIVAVTHIGYESIPGKASDMDLARQSRDIDIIIGGHSHSYVDPNTPEKTPYWVDNAVGKPVLVTQTGKYGRNIGYIKIDLDAISKMKADGTRNFEYMYIPVTDRFSAEAYDKDIKEFLAPYKHIVDSVNAKVIGWSLQDMPNNDRAGAYSNWVADFAFDKGRDIADSLRTINPDFPQVDMSFMNVGGIRQPMKEGAVTEGQILSTFPFSNRMEIIEIKGKDIIEALKIAAIKGGEGISDNVIVVTDREGNLQNVYINGKKMNPEQTYIVSTIDYISQGNDDYVTMANNRILWQDEIELSRQILDYINDLTAKGIPVYSNPYGRFVTNPSLSEE